MIRLENVTVEYDKPILKDINLSIDDNKVTFIIGKNGAGKSTLANVIGGIIYPKNGNIYIDDLLLTKKTDNKEIRKKVGMVFQNPSNQIIFSKVYDDIEFTLENMKVKKELIPKIIKDSLEKVGMIDYINSNPYTLSGGQKQRAVIASAISTNPKHLIFDEATSMLDSSGKKSIYNLISKLKKDMAIVFITNNMDELIYADDVIIIDNLSVNKYSICEILKNTSILSKYNLKVPFIFNIANKLNIKDISKVNEDYILKRIDKK